MEICAWPNISPPLTTFDQLDKLIKKENTNLITLQTNSFYFIKMSKHKATR